ncbi:MAG: 50S ribosomal protein L32 [Chloroherpetonaceae bacterium]|nr:50S ribosomal protein L32 [Chloroherpetonaceae bacterium]MCS7211782.1 50S ribosomal protein L32 [Chloroherpetonaceae bacterium]MDW8020461.1 50S ribosomal protein L32 [Chloroherpetonaceae bacterium]MDW8465333.1 50S ribosomal protein L32 [Chloroherpetonaceae bacterium]
MPNPKRRMSSSRTAKRRAQFNARTKPATMITCPNCGATTIMHRACYNCGYYRGRILFKKNEQAAQ